MQIEYSKKFVKKYKKCPNKIKTALKNRLKIFIKNQHDPTLNNHDLSGKYKNYKSINITSDWRAIYQEYNNGKIAYFIILGTHSELYT
ncbi:MAG: type II toxin-antitoxin system mRNA interferase toxin, RelE/StbE family [Patescibacteria group bacterium]